MIPLEAIVFLELVRMFYSFLAEADIHLIDQSTGNSIKIQNQSMIEELGQIQYLFCDKTGTLTKN